MEALTTTCTFLNLIIWTSFIRLVAFSDPDILADIEEWKKNLAQYSSQYVGQTLVYLNGTFEECRFQECNLGNLICDAMVIITGKHYLHLLIHLQNTGDFSRFLTLVNSLVATEKIERQFVLVTHSR